MPMDCEPWPGKTNASDMKLASNAGAAANYSDPHRQCSPNQKSKARTIQMRIDHDTLRRCPAPLFPSQLCAQTDGQYPPIPGVLHEMLCGARCHDRMQHPGGANIPANPWTEPPKTGTDGQRAAHHDDAPLHS